MSRDSKASEPSTAALCIARWGILRKAKTYLNYNNLCNNPRKLRAVA